MENGAGVGTLILTLLLVGVGIALDGAVEGSCDDGANACGGEVTFSP